MRISTFNIQNNINTYKKEKADIIYNFFKEKDIDIIGLQEVFYKCNHDLKRLIKPNYTMLGKYRFYLKLLFYTSNEKTPIITKYKVVKHKTYHLPFYPSHLKRVMTHVIVNYNEDLISIYNTHLESTLNNVKLRQLNKIIDIIKKDPNPKILMGDFNLKIGDTIFDSFINKLEEYDLKIIPLNEKTFKESKGNKEIDHIFISNEFTIKNKEVVKDILTSDHYPVIIDLEYKKDN